ncbi:MAG TPA: hypothetical protein VJR89_39585 [Polyangiales bacterium]|nr:hypothetical protein [Polyangiales bacterium]
MSRAFAHAAPAAPPIFDPGPCIRVIDRDAEPSARFGYRVPFDDVQLTAGDIALPDALTHQFFAFRGSIILNGFVPELWTTDADEPRSTALPLWVVRRDVERAQESSNEHTLGYDLSDVNSEHVLATMTSLEQRWLPITRETARVPITFAQALQGVFWDVKDVEPGLYTVAGYIFSPPYNGWEVRPGLVKIVSQASNPPAAVVSRIQEAIFPGQGRRVRACLDVPAETELRAFVRFQDHPEQGWMAWGDAQQVTSGDVELCFRPSRELQGSARVRFDLTADGQTQSFYSPDTLVVLGGEAPCQESDSICCERAQTGPAADGGEMPDAGVVDADESTRRETGGCASSRGTSAGDFRGLLVLGAIVVSRRARRVRAR